MLESGHDGIHLSPEQGEYYLDMTDQPKNSHIAKDLDLAAGASYTLTFDGVNRHEWSTLSPMQVIIGGEVVDTLNPAVSKEWTNYSYEFTGSADPSKNRIEFKSIGPNCGTCGKGFGLANINVN